MLEINRISVFDPPLYTGKPCGCQNPATFVLAIHETELHLCTDCISEVAKRIIDGLV